MLEKLGVKALINASGTLTKLGGCRVLPESVAAMVEVARNFVDMDDLMEKSGKYVAGFVGAEDALITNGAAAGIVLSVAACMTEGKLENMASLPDTKGMKNEVLMQFNHWHDNPYASLATIPGGKLKIVGQPSGIDTADMIEGISEKTAAILHTYYEPDDSISLEKVVEIAQSHSISLIVDAAAELPPVTNLNKFVKSGADLVVFSGGKDISAPNDTGVIFGKRSFISACKSLGPLSYLDFQGQRRTFVGRPMKTSKEDVLAFVAAFEEYLKTDHEGKIIKMHAMCDKIVRAVHDVDSTLTVEKVQPGKGERIRPISVPRVRLSSPHMTAEFIAEELKKGDPPIYVTLRDDGIYINPQCLTDDEADKLISSLSRILGLANIKSAIDIPEIGKGGVYSHSTSSGKFVFVSGISGQNNEKETPFSEQLEITFGKLARILGEAGSSLSGILKLTVYLADKEYFTELNRMFAKYFPTQPPARTTVVCNFVVPNIRVEIDAVAVKLNST